MEPTPLQTRLWSLGNLLTSLDLGTGLRTLFFLALPLWMLSCGSSAQATPVPISSPMPTPSPREVLQQSSERMLSLDTAHFVLEHEAGGSSVLFPGVDILRIEGRVDMPDRFSIEVEAMSTFPRSFIPINLVAVVGQARMTDFLNTDKWNNVPLDSLPFDFGDLGRTLGDIIAAVEDPVFETSEKVDGVLSWSVVGTVPSESMGSLLSAPEGGYRVRLELSIGQERGLLRKARIVGQIYSTDPPGLVRVLTIHSFDEPLEISLPQSQ